MHIDKDLSEKIDCLRFLMVAFIVLFHAITYPLVLHYRGSTLSFSPGPAARFIFFFFSDTFARAGVPFLFIISGFLFFKESAFTQTLHHHKLFSRFRSLFLPLIIWNALWLLALGLAYQCPIFEQFFTSDPLDCIRNPWRLSNCLLGITQPPKLPHLWFVRDLLLLSVLSPIFWWVAKYASYPALALLFPAWLINTSSPPPSFLFQQYGTPLFFLIGAILSVGRWQPRRLLPWISQNKNAQLVFLSFYLILLCSDAWFKAFLPFDAQGNYLHKWSILATILLAWEASFSFPRTLVRFLLRLSPFTFFIYIVHNPILICVKDPIYKFFPPQNDAGFVLYYFGFILFSLCLSIAGGLFLKRYAPSRLFPLLNGCR